MRQPVDAGRLRAFMRALAREARGPLQVYLVGGSTAVLEGWREATIDVDLAFGESDDAVLRALPGLKDTFDINVELASPADFYSDKTRLAGPQSICRSGRRGHVQALRSLRSGTRKNRAWSRDGSE